MTQLLLSNLVYGQRYADLYLGPHLIALLDESNLPAVRDRVSVECYTDAATKPILEAHPNVQRLNAAGVPVYLHVLPSLQYDARYNLLAACFHRSLHRAHHQGEALMFSTADTIYGQGFFPALFGKLDQGHDAVMGVTMRGTAEAMADPMTRANRALTASELYGLCRGALHPLWTHSNWRAPDFSRLPYALIWSDADQLIVRPLTITAVAFTPNDAMLTEPPQTPDMVVDPHLANPYYAEDWSEFPMVELGYLSSFWPPYRPGPADAKEYVRWAEQAAPAGSLKNLERCFSYYDPLNPPRPAATRRLRSVSDVVIREIQSRVEGRYVDLPGVPGERLETVGL